ncbi:UvrD-helicase domain-containing protein [Herbaspirillum huttiense]|uniref:UvrD-helicase domain-containing protein n=1 Tax=Herbaspirillum huttiense TaxID=863372 RepID=UPI002176DAD8|nr:UvrD-helicase domain-containing protein [Herbaspirillum huttiense]UWE15238.1 AAA family ATPase [Herbaspirillum huttiense]
MNTSWWRSLEELDKDQKAFILLAPEGKHLLVGPPGSGKTNLLLLRAQYLAGRGEKNVLILTFTKTLTDFIQSGIATKGLIKADQIRTYHSWASEHIMEHLGERIVTKGAEFDEEVRSTVVSKILAANDKAPSKQIYSAIFVDEAQDLTSAELEALLVLSDKVCICGDGNQGIYRRNGLEIAEKLGLQQHSLKRHYRIGQKIARIADRLIPPEHEELSLEATSNYNPKVQGDSIATMTECASRDEQFALMLEKIRIQLLAYNEDTIGVICGARETLSELRARFDKTELADLVHVHKVDKNATFNSERRIHVMTIHGSKGTEFRAVHMYGVEELEPFPQRRTRLAYTAVTRAKTSLNAYRTGPTSHALENAFSEPTSFQIDELFSNGEK